MQTFLFVLWCTLIVLSEYSSAEFSETYTIDLDDSYLQGWFKGYTNVTFRVDASDTFDFWVTDEDGFDEWDSNGTPSTSSLFPYTYCNDCSEFTVTFDSPSSSTKYRYIVSALFPETTPVGSITATFYGSGSFSDAEEEEDSYVCFSSRSTVKHANGTVSLLRDCQLGDEILSTNYDGSLEYSAIVHMPHKLNNHHSHFVRMFTEASGGDESFVEVTREHLIPTCSISVHEKVDTMCSHCKSSYYLAPPALIAAKDITSTVCIPVVKSDTLIWTKVSNVEFFSNREGIYSVVTNAPYPVVDGHIASSFGISHLAPRMFYSIHRIAYKLGIRNNHFVSGCLFRLTEFAEKIAKGLSKGYATSKAEGYFVETLRSYL